MREKILKPLGLWEAPTHGTVSSTRLYSLRHSRASHMLNKMVDSKGIVDIFAIANFLGHADIRSSQVYLHTDIHYFEYLRKSATL
jgi:site-specific recombinase XerC